MASGASIEYDIIFRVSRAHIVFANGYRNPRHCDGEFQRRPYGPYRL